MLMWSYDLFVQRKTAGDLGEFYCKLQEGDLGTPSRDFGLAWTLLGSSLVLKSCPVSETPTAASRHPMPCKAEPTPGVRCVWFGLSSVRSQRGHGRHPKHSAVYQLHPG